MTARLLALTGLVTAALLIGITTASPQPPLPSQPSPPATTAPEQVLPEAYSLLRWRPSRALGLPWSGRLVRGVQLPAEGPDFFTWDLVHERSPNRGWRRYGHDALIRMLLRVMRGYREVNPGAPRVGIADISRPRGGDFSKRFGGLGHASHQNGLDVDVIYPRLDGREQGAFRPGQIDPLLAQNLVDRFVREGVKYVFVGPRTELKGPRRVVRILTHHDDHMHVRIRLPAKHASAAR